MLAIDAHLNPSDLEWLFHRVHGAADSVTGDIVKGVEREKVVRYAEQHNIVQPMGFTNG
jgi:hypothetical protein